MTKRIRLTDENDPLTQTDRVLAGFEQLNQSTSQPVNKLTSQQAKKSTSQQADNPGIQQVKKSTSQRVQRAPDQQISKPESQSSKTITSQQVNKSEIQQVDKLILKKSTFQLSGEVLQELDKLHLRLQLELGKTETPYKEVIVEEAIARLLLEMKANEARLLQDLKVRQQKRDR
jgi:hypothetical protein